MKITDHSCYRRSHTSPTVLGLNALQQHLETALQKKKWNIAKGSQSGSRSVGESIGQLPVDTDRHAL